MKEETFGFTRIRMIPGAVLLRHVSKEDRGCALLQTFDYAGVSLYDDTICNNDDNANSTTLFKFFDEKVPTVTMLGVILSEFIFAKL